jgi:hypothetical protein
MLAPDARFVSIDRLIGGVCRLFPKMYSALAIGRPETVIRWHRGDLDLGLPRRSCSWCRNLVPAALWLADYGRCRRQFPWFGTTPTSSGRMDRQSAHWACGWEQIPRYLMRSRWCIRRDIYPPRSNAERLIGSIRRERIDHIVVVGERHLRHVLPSYLDYYNDRRTHYR